jgi:hypothetical protein
MPLYTYEARSVGGHENISNVTAKTVISVKKFKNKQRCLIYNAIITIIIIIINILLV